MDEVDRAAVPSDPTTPDPTPLTNPVPDEVRAALKHVLGQEFPGVDRTCDLLSYLHAKELILWRAEVGVPSVDQIEAATDAVIKTQVRCGTDLWQIDRDIDPQQLSTGIGSIGLVDVPFLVREALVAACSVRGDQPENAKTEE